LLIFKQISEDGSKSSLAISEKYDLLFSIQYETKKKGGIIMDWLAEYWYIFLLALVAGLFLFGHRTKGSEEKDVHVHRHGVQADGKTHKSGHGCCH
jgi:hypothetical protein